MFTLSLSCHIIIRLFIPLLIGMILIILISLVPLGVQTNILFNITKKQMSSINQEAINRRINNTADYILTIFKQIDTDVNVLHDYSYSMINNELPINNYYKSFYGISSIDNLIPTYDTDGYVYASVTYINGITNIIDLYNVSFINETSLIDNVFRSIYKSSDLYDSLYIGLNNGLFRLYPYVKLDNFATYTYVCNINNLLSVGYNPRCENWYIQSTNNHNINYLPPSRNIDNTKTFITVSKSLFVNNILIGVVAANIKLDQINNIISSSSVTTNGYYFMIDINGRIISYFNNDKIINSSIFTIESSITNNIISSMVTNNIGTISLNKNNTNWFLSYTVVHSNYILVSMYPEFDLYVEANDLNVLLYWTIINGIFVVICIFVIIAIGALIINIIIGKKYANSISDISTFLLSVINSNGLEMTNINASSSELIQLKNNLIDLRTTICYGNTAFFEGQLDKALETYNSALVIFDRTKNIKGLAMCYNNIANVKKQLGQSSDALSLYNKSINYVEQLMKNSGSDVNKILDCKIMLANRYMNIGVLYKDINKFDEALVYFNKSLDYNRETDNLAGISKVNNNLGQLLLQQGKMNEAGQQIIDTYELISNRDNVDIISLQYSMMSMGILEYFKNNYTNSIDWLSKILDTYKETNVYIQQTCLEYMDNSYTALGSLNVASEIKKLRKRNNASKNVLFVLDSSGSMGGSPIKQCKQSIKDIITNHLDSNDNVSLITFDSNIKEIFPFINKDNHLNQILNDIDTKVIINGNTAFYDALNYALSKIDGLGTNYIIALTDGEDNRSTINHKQLSLKMESMFINLIIITVGSLKTENIIKGFCNSCKKKGKGLYIKSESNNNKDISDAFNNVAKILTGQLNVDTF